MINTGLDFTHISDANALGGGNNGFNFTISGYGAQLVTGSTFPSGQCAIDALGSRFIRWEGLTIYVGQPAVQISNPTPPTISATSTPPSPSAGDASNGPPIIHINGANPAIIKVGDTYGDLGATITGPAADLNLDITTTFFNGVVVNPIQIDTSTVATDTIDYVATDQNGLTATSTRTVIIQLPAHPSTPPSSTATSSPNMTVTPPSATTTDASSTAQ